MVRKFDFLVIGSGIAGMSFALKVAEKGTVALICKAGMEEANTYFAQGGIASVTNLAVDNFEKHIEDTMIAGDWISDRAAVEKVVRNAPAQIQELIKWGVNFDKKENGEFDLHREGGHSEFRILHHKDNTGAEIQTSLIEAVKQHPNITIFTNFYAVEIITQHHLGIIVTRYTPGIKCYGAYVLNEATGEVDTFLSKVTVMATGGCEAVYRHTTGIHSRSPCRPLSVRRHQSGFGRTEQHPSSVCHRRMFMHRPARRQPLSVQLAHRSRGICRCRRQTCLERTGALRLQRRHPRME